MLSPETFARVIAAAGEAARPANWQQHADAVAKEEDDGA